MGTGKSQMPTAGKPWLCCRYLWVGQAVGNVAAEAAICRRVLRDGCSLTVDNDLPTAHVTTYPPTTGCMSFRLCLFVWSFMASAITTMKAWQPTLPFTHNATPSACAQTPWKLCTQGISCLYPLWCCSGCTTPFAAH